LQQGRFAKARDVMQTVERAIASSANGAAKAAPHAAAPHERAESEIGRGYGPMSLKSELASMKARLVMETADWSQMKGQASFDNVDELFVLGVASVPLNDRGRADAALEHLNTAATSLPDRDAREVAAIMAAELEGLMRLARNDRPGALASLARGAQLEARRPKPVARPYPLKPAGELYGEILLGTGDAAAAVVQFKASLARTPRRAASLLGLARAAGAARLRTLAGDTARDFLKAWHLADSDRPELNEARALAR
jgi:hypothetical protein